MLKYHDDKRSAPRSFFNEAENVSAAINGVGQSFCVAVLNLSSIGIQFSQGREDYVTVKTGDILTLFGLKGVNGLDGIGGVTMEVRWVIDQDFLGIVSVGCHFLDMPDEYRKKIQQVVDDRLA